MPSRESHLLIADRNQKLIEHLRKDIDRFSEWITTVAFYKALHLIEAVFAGDPSIRHGRSHEHRDQCLKSRRHYAQLYKFYRPLWAASTVARYLEDQSRGDEYSSFSEYLSPQQGQSIVLGHYLHQIEQAAAKFLKLPAKKE
jgi:hypothetical protein